MLSINVMIVMVVSEFGCLVFVLVGLSFGGVLFDLGKDVGIWYGLGLLNDIVDFVVFNCKFGDVCSWCDVLCIMFVEFIICYVVVRLIIWCGIMVVWS